MIHYSKRTKGLWILEGWITSLEEKIQHARVWSQLNDIKLKEENEKSI